MKLKHDAEYTQSIKELVKNVSRPTQKTGCSKKHEPKVLVSLSNVVTTAS